ncbi:MAG: hypothetical protein RL639_628 [Verrucomicrobiota bacterium]|jgi:hypothetical protein
MKRNLLLTLLAAALSVGCASRPVVQSRGNLQEVAKQGTTYHLDARRAGLGENEVRGLRDRLQKAGLSPASAETAKLIVTLSSDLRSSTERQHTGGKNGVAYDRQVNERRLTLTVAESRAGAGKVLMEVSSADAGSASAESLLNAALAGLGS